MAQTQDAKHVIFPQLHGDADASPVPLLKIKTGYTDPIYLLPGLVQGSVQLSPGVLSMANQTTKALLRLHP